MAEDFDSCNCDFLLPPLFITTKTGAKQMWRVGVAGNVVVKEWGHVGGKMQLSSRPIKGVNKGKANETTDEIQAQNVAKIDWVEKTDKSYLPEDEAGLELLSQVKAAKQEGGANHKVTSKMSVSSTSVKKEAKPPLKSSTVPDLDLKITPMKGDPWTPHEPKHLNFEKGVWIQPKLDGVRCVAWINGSGEPVMVTSSGKQFVFLQHIRDALKTTLSHNPGIILDGEMYAHTLFEKDGTEIQKGKRFGLITGACRSVLKTPSPYESQMKFFVFDIYDQTGKIPQDERFTLLDSVFDSSTPVVLVQLPRELVHDIPAVFDLHRQYEKMGYEGVILRDRSLKYEQKRSLYLKKFKNFFDKECEIVGFKEAEGGREKGAVVWRCRWDEGIFFDVRPMGTLESRKILFKEGEKHIGKFVTVVYQELSDDGVPRFPVSKEGFRDYE